MPPEPKEPLPLARLALARWPAAALSPRRPEQRALSDVDLRADARPEAFDGLVESIEVGGVTFTRVQSSSLALRSLPPGDGCKDVFYLVANRHGGWTLKQQDRVQQVRVGDTCLVDARLPYQLSFQQGVSLCAITLPLPWLRRHLRSADTLGSRTISRDAGWGRVLSSLCLEISNDVGLATRMQASQVAEQLGGLLTAALEPLDPGSTAPDRGSLRDQAERVLAERLDEPGLSAADVAGALGVSVRTLHRLFAGAGSTFTAILRRRRMERAVALLRRPNLLHLSVAEIGSRCGFHDPSHFSREFRRAQGLPPARWRQQYSA